MKSNHSKPTLKNFKNISPSGATMPFALIGPINYLTEKIEEVDE
jgi:hypothetical protein